MTARVLVTGSRHLEDPTPVREGLEEAFSRYGPFTCVHGRCPEGADKHADDWAVEHEDLGIVVERHPADWHGPCDPGFCRHRRRRPGDSCPAAGPRRSLHMVNLGALVCLAFPLGKSPGTRKCMEYAAKAGIPVVNLTERAEAAGIPVVIHREGT